MLVSKLANNAKGFTILELMIATVVFSVLLLGAATMLVQIGRLYYKGVVTSRTQEATRTVTDDIGRSLQFGSNDVVIPAADLTVNTPAGNVAVKAFCIGSTRYSYIINGQVSSAVEAYEPGDNQEQRVRHGLWRDSKADNACTPLNILADNPQLPGNTGDSEGREMLGEGMRLYKLAPPRKLGDTEDSGLVSFSVGIVYGADDGVIDFTDGLDNPRCFGAALGAQWCAVSALETTVFRRINGS
jgi:prepilin-type N-terminal cleavage/methylation domain-containing protein